MQYKIQIRHMTLTGGCLQEPRNAVTRQKVTTTKYNSFRASNTNLSRAYPCLSWHRVRQERVVTHGQEEDEEKEVELGTESSLAVNSQHRPCNPSWLRPGFLFVPLWKVFEL